MATLTRSFFEGYSETERFRRISDYVFGGRNFGKTKSMRVIFFPKYSKSMIDFKNIAKNIAKVFLSEIIASELVSLNSLY